jgi:hypothetical protein
MNDEPTDLRKLLDGILTRRRRVMVWSRLAACWAAAAFLGLAIAFIERKSGWASSLAVPAVAIMAIVAALVLLSRGRRGTGDLRALAREIEARHPELDGRLLTTVQQAADAAGRTYLQERLLGETVAISQRSDWSRIVPASRILIAQASHWLALVFLGVVLWGLRVTSGPGLVARIGESGITVTPGDAAIEKGNSLVVFVKIAGQLPASVEMIADGPDHRPARIPLVKSLADPIFGGSIAEVSSNFIYHIEHGGQRTRDFKVTVFEYPRLERADMEVSYPAYTGLPLKRIENTKRLSAVQGSTVDLALQLNKAVASAMLVPKEKGGKPVRLQADTNRAVAVLSRLPLEHSHSYDLQLVDAEGRTNKVPAQFVFEVLTNRVPEFRLASPKGDLRPSPLEEIAFEGTVWDDFGVKAYGLGYAIPGQDPKYLELGKEVSAKEKKTFQYSLHLEDLKLQPDQLISWFMWADDVGPDGQLRRTAGDLFFGEVRPFDEIFREGQGMDGGQGGQQGQQGQSRTEKLTELQKQIISATWRLRRENAGSNVPPATATPTETEKEPIPVRQSQNNRQILPHPLPRLFSSGGERVFGQTSRSQSDPDPASDRPRRARNPASAPSASSGTNSYTDDATVVRDSQAQALDQVGEMSGRTQDPRAAALWSAAKKEMEQALSNLDKAKQSPATLPEALAAEQAAYQALLRLQQHEYQVMRNRRNQQQGGGGGRQQEMQRQLDQLDLKSEENRYETQRQAQKQQTSERREQLQVQSRLQELARRQEDLNDRFKELQAALQEAKTEQEREEIRRRLKRLQEEEQQMLNDVDELRQRMDRPENQSKMAEERKQLDETRKDVQQAADAANQGQASQALASGTRAQRQLQQLRDQVRQQNSNQFSDDLRQMRNEARELARQQDEILKNLQTDSAGTDHSLAGSTNREEALSQLGKQTQRMTNLIDRATQLSQETEDAEPVVSRQLYDSVRKFSQDSTKAVQETQEELLSRGLMTREVYDTLQSTSQQDGSKLLDATSQLVKQDLVQPASRAGERTRSVLNNLKQGVERAAESILGDDTEALKMAQQEIDQLTEQLQREIRQNGARGGTNGTNQAQSAASQKRGQGGTNAIAQADASGSQTNLASNVSREGQGTNEAASAQNGSRSNQQQRGGNRGAQNSQQANNNNGNQPSPGGQARDSQQANEQANNGQPQGRQSGTQSGGGQAGQQQGQRADTQGDSSQPGQANAQDRDSQRANAGEPGGANQRGGDRRGARNTSGGARNWDFNTIFDNYGGGGYAGGPLTGENFVDWSDRLRDVEEMVDDPALRNEVAKARERARLMRQDYKRDAKKPDWAVVQLQVMKPLIEVRDRIADELARRENSDALVPIDRDPVPTRYSDLVRRYYEELGKDK